MTDGKDISQVVEKELCHSCGACSGVCPEGAIGFVETAGGYLYPEVDPDRCSSCGLCLTVCPGESFGSRLIEMLPEDPFTGQSIGSFVGKSTDSRIHANSQSGGIASGLLIHAMRSGDISGAVVVRMGPGTDPRPSAYLASSEEEIEAAQKSKYTPVPLLEILAGLEGRPGAVALVGLSCHIHGLVKACELDPALGEKIRYRIGLICDRSLSCASIDYLSMKAGFDDDEVKELVFRDKSCGGYPGNVRVSSPQGRSVVLRDSARKRIKPYLTPPRCHLCFDKMNVLSDVTIGDPHGLASADRKNGESVCIARSDEGYALVRSAIGSGRVSLRETGYPDIVRGQKIDRKRGAWKGFCEEWRSRGRSVPDYYPMVLRKAGGPAASSRADAANALDLSSFTDRKELLAWLIRNDRKDMLLDKARSVYTYPLLAARRILSGIRHGRKT